MNDRKQIEKQIQIYINGMDESDGNKATEVFANCATVAGYLHGELMDMFPEDFAELVEEYPARNKKSQNTVEKQKVKNVDFEVVCFAIEGPTAMVRVKFTSLGISYIDSLSFIKDDKEWKIWHRLFITTNPYIS